MVFGSKGSLAGADVIVADEINISPVAGADVIVAFGTGLINSFLNVVSLLSDEIEWESVSVS